MYTYSNDPGGYPMAPCLIALMAEVAASPRYQNSITNLGQLGDATHQAQGSDSDHNPWLFGMVRAIDLGGDYNLLMELKHFLDSRYGAHDGRIFAQGYAKGPDSTITDWDNPGGTHYASGDEGHLHISCTRDYAGCMDTSPWGIPGAPTGVVGSGIAPQEDDEMTPDDKAQMTRIEDDAQVTRYGMDKNIGPAVARVERNVFALTAAVAALTKEVATLKAGQ